MTLRLAVSAGESSGDDLAASVVSQLRLAAPDAELFGVSGPRMRAAGVESMASIEALNVMGLFEVVRHVPGLFRLRRALTQACVDRHAAGFVGFDAPDFNLGLARSLKRTGVRAIQVVAPSVWAWRSYRVRRIARSLDLLLTLFPFEPALFRRAGLNARFIGHPLADAVPEHPDRAASRVRLGLTGDRPVVALLPGSRPGEIRRHAAMLCEAAETFAAEDGLESILLLADERHRRLFTDAAGREPGASGIRVAAGATRDGLIAADVALAASGTVTLEALLTRTPMVVFYRLGGLTYQFARRLRLVKSRWISLPNVLAETGLVPERIQHAARAETLVADARAWLDDAPRRARFDEIALAIHRQLARGAAANAAEAILTELGDSRRREVHR